MLYWPPMSSRIASSPTLEADAPSSAPHPGVEMPAAWWRRSPFQDSRLSAASVLLTRLRRLVLQAPFGIALITLALYLPSAWQTVQLSPDMVEHVDIARRFLDGQGYVLGIKAYHVGGRDVVHDGLVHRPPLLTFVIASLLALDLDLHAIQALHTVVGALAAALVCSIGSQLFGRTVGIAAGILAATNPWAFKVQIPLMTEALTGILMLAAIRVLIGAADRPAAVPFALAGLFFGLGYLARPPVLIVLMATVAATVFVSSNRRLLTRPLLWLFAGAAVVIVPMSLFSLLTRGRLIYSGKTYLFAVPGDRSVMEEGFVHDVPPAGEFILANLDFIAESISGLVVTYARWIFFDPELLLVLLPGWPLALLALWRGQYPRRVWIPLAAAAANFVFYSLTWSTAQDRFLLPTVLLLLPFGVDGLLRALRWALAGLRSIVPTVLGRAAHPTLVGGLIVAGIVLFWLPVFLEQYRGGFAYFDRAAGTRTDDGIRWTGPPRWVNDDDFKRVVSWALGQTATDTVLAAGQPWPLGLFAHRPVVMAPVNLDEASLRRFIVEYRVGQFLVDGRDVRRRRYREYLEELSDDGVRVVKLGAVTAFDTSALWR